MEREGTRHFQRLDALLLNGLCRQGLNVVCVSGVIQSSHPAYSAFSGYDGEVNSDNFRLVDVLASDAQGTSWMVKIANWARSATRLWAPMRAADFVVIFMPSPLGFLAVLTATTLRRKRVVYLGGDWSASLSPRARAGEGLIRGMRGILQTMACALSPLLLVRDPKACRDMARARKGVHLAAPFTTFSPDMEFYREDTCGGDKIVCLTVGGLLPHKGIMDILRALQQVRAEGYPVAWWHAGASYTGAFRDEVERLVDQAGLGEAVRFLGYLGHEELLNAYRQVDLLVHAARAEGMPRVLAEAMSQSLPVVVTQVGGIGEALKADQDAVFVRPEDPRSLAEGIRRVLRDGSLRRSLIANGRAWARVELGRDPVKQILSVLKISSTDNPPLEARY